MRSYFLFLFFLLNFNCVFLYSQNLTDFQKDSIELTKYIRKVRAYFDSNYDSAYIIAKKTLEKSKNNKFLIGRIRLLQSMAEIEYHYKNSFDTSIMHLNEMRNISEAIGYKRGIPWYELNLANVYYYQNDYIKAMELYKSAVAKGISINDSIIVASALSGRSEILMFWGQIDSSLHYAYKALKYAPKSRIVRTHFFIYDDIAHIYRVAGEFDSSYFYYQKCLELTKERDNKPG